ncbi:MAG: hypothetical protein JW881_12140 [Spirochaetales bacterium]|nr:hypothetical protein [Spirochaetales bacterium]
MIHKKTHSHNGLLFRFEALLLVTLFLAGLAACSLDERTGRDETAVEQSHGTRSIAGPDDFGAPVYAPDKKGYLAVNAAGKKFLHIEGTGYQMGYQHGYLLARNVSRLASDDFIITILANYMDMTASEFTSKVGAAVTRLVCNAFRTTSGIFEDNIPEEFRDEMRGIYDGVTAKGYAVEYDNILVVNIAFDILLGVAYPIVSPVLGIKNNFAPHMCDGFIVYGNGTTDKRTLMGRNFMFTDAYLHEEMLFVEYCPRNGYRFVSPTLPGWVGLVAGMNANGIGIGCDMAPAVAANVTNVGMGVLMANRRALQYSRKLSEGVDYITNADLGISWIIALASGKSENKGAVIETSATLTKIRYADYTYPRFYNLISGLPKQIEDKPDLLVFANHYIVPQMVILSGNAAIPDSRWRYETLTNLLLDNYGGIDVEKAKRLVDYLHPPAYNYYGTNPRAAVKGSRSLYDLTNGEIWSLYGHYGDEWIHYRF